MSALPAEAILQALETALGHPISMTDSLPVGGGCINAATRIETSAGLFFVKHSPVRDRRFSVEAKQLEALASSGTSLVVGAPVAWRDASDQGPGFLVTHFIETGRRGAGFDEALGRGLAELHRATADAFGFEIDTYCGDTVQPNQWSTSWHEFYGERRLRHQLRLLRDDHKIGTQDAEAFARLIDRLGDYLDVSEPPSLIHGDLWSGNLLVTRDGQPAIIDPACYYAHREAELGMTTLFGGFSNRVYAAYEETWPLPPGWRGRNPLYQLWHVANHATLFGGRYVDDTLRLVRAYA